MINLGFDRRPSLSCFLSLFGFSSPSQRSRGIGGIWFITPEGEGKKKKKTHTGKLLENSVTLDRKKARLQGWARMSWQLFRTAWRRPWCVCLCICVCMLTTQRRAKSSRGPVAVSSCLSFHLPPPASLPVPLLSLPQQGGGHHREQASHLQPLLGI